MYTICHMCITYTHRMINRPAPPLLIAIFYSPFFEIKRHKQLRKTYAYVNGMYIRE